MRNIRKTSLFLVCIFLFSSCMKNLDFDQIEDLTATPVFKTSVMHFTLNQVAFFDRINSIEVIAPIETTSKFVSLKSSFVRENLKELRLEFEINNEFDRDFTVFFQFLDDNDDITHSFKTFYISANNLKYLHQEKIIISENQQFLSSTKVRAFVRLSPSANGAVINPNIEKKLVFKTAGTFFLNL